MAAVLDESMDDLDGDDRDDVSENKRKSRNMSEKKRRDQFNILIHELSFMVSSNRKLDKSSVLKAAITFLRDHNTLSERSQSFEIDSDWKPAFLSNEEFTHLILEALDGFLIAISQLGEILHVSESISTFLGHVPADLVHTSFFDLIPSTECPSVRQILSQVDGDSCSPFLLGDSVPRKEH
ncbi:unnamed protein product [Darwinula stevensoni]|uniref:Uncharacterized protein n=1 Tax=Darwinula stevensoni TaxID=69355 RepID=A0A7R8WY15_9CRUS|nr:unnamed protein product [Darwinula stevensoni]CAG0878565.1 unnamed protein product [Darwinula stevensoni]